MSIERFKRWTCDVCGAKCEAPEHGLPPACWTLVAGPREEDWHACSNTCRDKLRRIMHEAEEAANKVYHEVLKGLKK